VSVTLEIRANDLLKDLPVQLVSTTSILDTVRTPSLRRMVRVLVALLFLGFHDFSAAQGAANPSVVVATRPSIRAVPNPVRRTTASQVLGSVTLSWSVPSAVTGSELRVSADGRPEVVVAQAGITGTIMVKWIRAGHKYEFRIYDLQQIKIPQAQVVVRMK
jgi:hypothetical protein